MNVYGWVRRTGGVSWYRVREPLRGLSLLGHTTDYGPELNFGRLSEYDVVVTSVHGEAEASEGWEALARLPGRPLMVYDIDDDVWNFRHGLHQYGYWQNEDLLRNVQSAIACADIVTTPSPVLADIVSALNPNVHVLANYVPKRLTEMVAAVPRHFTVGYQGGDTHKYDIASVGGQLLKFIASFPDSRMAVWGASTYDGPFAERVLLTSWERNVWRYYTSLAMTVGLAPLEQSPFNDAKSAIKAVEYAALGIPCIATDSVTYRGTVLDGLTGHLVSDDKWFDALFDLYHYPVARAEMGLVARRRAALEWTIEGNAHRWEAVYHG